MKWSSRPLLLATLGTLLTAMNAIAAPPAKGVASRPLQFTSGGHVIGFTARDLFVAAGSHALRVEFVGARGVDPVSAAAGAPDGKAVALNRVTYSGVWDGITLAYDAPDGLLRSTYTVAPGAEGVAVGLGPRPRVDRIAPRSDTPSGDIDSAARVDRDAEGLVLVVPPEKRVPQQGASGVDPCDLLPGDRRALAHRAGRTSVTLNLSATDAGGSGDGTKNVYAQFIDGAGNVSDANPAAAGAQGCRGLHRAHAVAHR